MKYAALILYSSIATIFVIKVNTAEKVYPVFHTKIEWLQQLNTIGEVQKYVRSGDLSVNRAFWCDSVLQVYAIDINQQVYAAMQADTSSVKTNKK